MHAPFTDPSQWQILWPLGPTDAPPVTPTDSTDLVRYIGGYLSQDMEAHLRCAIGNVANMIEDLGFPPGPRIVIAMCETEELYIDSLVRAQLPDLIRQVTDQRMQVLDSGSDLFRDNQPLIEADVQLGNPPVLTAVHDSVAFALLFGGIG